MMNTDWSYWEQKSYLHGIDYLVIGAGIVGYSTSLFLRKKHPSAKIVVLERSTLPNGASTKNAGFACFGSPTELYDDIQNFGEDEVWKTVRKRWEGLQLLRETIGDEDLKLETHGSWDLITEKEQTIFDTILPLLPYYNQKIEEITGEKDGYSVDPNVSHTFGFTGVKTSFYNRLERQIDTASMNTSFYKKVISENIVVLFGVEATAINESAGKVVTKTGVFSAAKIALCVNGFASKFLPKEAILPARAQVLITEPIPNLNIKGTFHYQFGYYYFRNIDNRILFGGGRNMDKEKETTTEISTTPEIIDALTHILKTVILPMTPHKIAHTWAGIMGTGTTKTPIIKQISPTVFCGVRLGGMGIAIGTLVGKELAELLET